MKVGLALASCSTTLWCLLSETNNYPMERNYGCKPQISGIVFIIREG
jgi:hypothetical protein